MANPEDQFKLTYYVGAMLAHGGVLAVKDDALVFYPGTLERAMGAAETVIPFHQIKLVDVIGTIQEFLVVRTQEKVHKFSGSEPYKIRDRINHVLQQAAMIKPTASAPGAQFDHPVAPVVIQAATPAAEVPKSAVPAPAHSAFAGQCPKCFKNLRAEFNYCPFCMTALAPSCAKCFKKVEAGWKFCAFCSAPS